MVGTKTACGYDAGEWSTKPDHVAECLTCDWRLESKNALGTAAIHARKHKHKHCVRVNFEFAKIYNHEPS